MTIFKLVLLACLTTMVMGERGLAAPAELPRAEDYFSRYEGASVWRMTPADAAEGAAIERQARELLLDVWAARGEFVDVLIPASQTELFKSGRLIQWSGEPRLFLGDVAGAMRRQEAAASQEEGARAMLMAEERLRVSNTSFFLEYHPYAEIYAFMEQLAADHPQLVQLISIGQTVQGNAITGVVISRGGGANKETIFHMGCIHAREWIAGATMTYLMSWLVEQAQSGEEGPLDRYAWTVVPVANVDGYLWTWSNERLWRKNRRPNSLCYGVDNNRNFGYKWNTGGSSANQCAQDFHGPSADSEPETRAVEGYLRAAENNVVVFGDIHSYSQLWLTPWGYTCQQDPPRKDYDMQIQFSQAAVAAIFSVHDRLYTPGPLCQTLYQASGISVDWAYGAQDIALSYTAELRGPSNSQAGFMLPPIEIIPQGQEFVAAMISLIQFLHQNK